MPFTFRSADGNDYLSNLRRLIAFRWAILASTALLVLTAPAVLDIQLPQVAMLAVIALTGLFNILVDLLARKARSARPHELTSQLLLDIAALSALVFFSGGATNPLVSLLLPPVAIAALALPARHVLAVGACAVAAYSLLMVTYLPLSIADPSRATHLHLVGMWLTFVVSAGMIGWIILRMTGLIRTRDADLAAAREQALRDERVMAMGTLAAGAAHELGTPLATMTLVAGELVNDSTLSASARADVALLRQQIGICRDIVTRLSHRAAASDLENPPCQAVDRWLDSLRQNWHAIRPQAASRLIIGSSGDAPQLSVDPRLEQAVLNLLNNAANASTTPIEIRLTWNATLLSIEIRDAGPGFPSHVLELGGLHGLPAHAGGSGIGLMLTRSAIEQLGGRLLLSNPDDGGALACIEWPRQGCA